VCRARYCDCKTALMPRTKSKRPRRPASRTRKPKTYWSQHVTQTSDAMTLEPQVFKKASPRAIAQSVKRSAERSHRRKSTPFRSAMSMLTFFINRAGSTLSAARRRVLERAKAALRELYGRPQPRPR